MAELKMLNKKRIMDNIRLIFGMLKEYRFQFHRTVNVIDLTISESGNPDQRLLLTDYGIVFINGDHNPKADWHWQQFLAANGCHVLFKENPYLGEKCFLAASDGYGIDYTAYETWKEAEEAMENAYNDAKPSEWDESFEEMSYCGGGSALLYDNGDTVYSWEIIRSDLECRKKVPDSDYLTMKVRTLQIPRCDAIRIQKDFSSFTNAADIRKRYGDHYTETHTATFSDDVRVDIKLCVDYDDSGRTPIWAEAALYKDGVLDNCTYSYKSFFRTWELDCGGILYRVDVKAE